MGKKLKKEKKEQKKGKKKKEYRGKKKKKRKKEKKQCIEGEYQSRQRKMMVNQGRIMDKEGKLIRKKREK